jgi:hypothetical protein
MHYNFDRQHKTLRVSPAMAAGVTNDAETYCSGFGPALVGVRACSTRHHS